MRRRSRLSSLEQFFLSVLAGLLLAVLVIFLFNLQMRPLIVNMAAAKVDNAVSLAVSEVVANDITLGVVSYDDLISFETDSTGQIVALKSNMGETNLLRVHILHRLISELNQLTVEELRIPMGNLTGNMLLSGLGPAVPVRVVSVGSVSTGFENEFSTAGINQTRHQIVLTIAVKVNLLLPGGITQHTVNSRITVAETVLMGQVPENYTYFSQFDTAKDASDQYFDYGAGR
jgi:sporulation protein YunB